MVKTMLLHSHRLLGRGTCFGCYVRCGDRKGVMYKLPLFGEKKFDLRLNLVQRLSFINCECCMCYSALMAVVVRKYWLAKTCPFPLIQPHPLYLLPAA